MKGFGGRNRMQSSLHHQRPLGVSSSKRDIAAGVSLHRALVKDELHCIVPPDCMGKGGNTGEPHKHCMYQDIKSGSLFTVPSEVVPEASPWSTLTSLLRCATASQFKIDSPTANRCWCGSLLHSSPQSPSWSLLAFTTPD